MRCPLLALLCLNTAADTKMTISSTVNSREYFFWDLARMHLGFVRHSYFWFSAPAKHCQSYWKCVPSSFPLFCRYIIFWTELCPNLIIPQVSILCSDRAPRFLFSINICFYAWLFYWNHWMCTDCCITAKWWVTFASLKILIYFISGRKGNTQNNLQNSKSWFLPNANSQ